jgi:hypothetical protein
VTPRQAERARQLILKIFIVTLQSMFHVCVKEEEEKEFKLPQVLLQSNAAATYS